MTDRLTIRIASDIRFDGVLCKERMAFLGRDGADLPLLHPIGSLFGGIDIERARLHGPQPVIIRRIGEVEMSLRVQDDGTGEEAVLEGQGLVFDPTKDSIGRVLVELGI